jgi:hypothetical protein
MKQYDMQNKNKLILSVQFCSYYVIGNELFGVLYTSHVSAGHGG